jgi:hypothetical protein
MPNLRMTRKTTRRLASALLAIGLCAGSAQASAYTIANALSFGCHEAITAQALRTVRLSLSAAAPLPTSDDEHALIGDLQFTPDADMTDLGGATLLVSVRDNDLKGRGADDLSELSDVHGDPANQEEHCLRGANDKEPGGTASAMVACRAFIRERIQEALAGLDASGTPDLSRRTPLSVHLSLRGGVTASLPTYYVRIGQAIHAAEDSFTHTYRTADERKITVALNWLDQVNGTLVEQRDGPGHSTALDDCSDADALRKTRHVLATQAATDLLLVTLAPNMTVEQKMASADNVLDTFLTYSPGCTYDNAWCSAPESVYQNPKGCGCRTGVIRGGSGTLLAGVAIALLLITRRRLGRRRSKGAVLGPLAFATALSVTAGRATAAQDDQTPGSAPTPASVTPAPADTHGPPPPTVTPVKEPGPRDPSQVAIGARGAVGGAIDKAGLVGSVGARLRVSKHWAFGLDGEWNPWLAFTGSTVRQGVINIYGTAILRFPLAYENFNLRTTANLGASYLLSDLYGAPSGSLGIFLGFSPLGLEWKLSRICYLVIDPLNIGIPIPQLRGVPLVYPQYRFTLGLEFYAG